MVRLGNAVVILGPTTHEVPNDGTTKGFGGYDELGICVSHDGYHYTGRCPPCQLFSDIILEDGFLSLVILDTVGTMVVIHEVKEEAKCPTGGIPEHAGVLSYGPLAHP